MKVRWLHMITGMLLTVLLGGYPSLLLGQGSLVDSMKRWLVGHPRVDSQYIHTLHSLSYRLSEKDIEQSFYYYQRTQALSDSIGFTYGKSLAQINLGLLLANSANFDASNAAYFKAIDYAEQCGALILKAVCLNNIGENFLSLRNFDKCRQYTGEAITINMGLKRDRGVAINYELLFRCNLEDGYDARAKSDLVKGWPFARKAADSSYIYAQYDVGFGKLKALEGAFDSAKFFYDRALREAGVQQDIHNEYLVYYARGKTLEDLPVPGRIRYLDTALNLAREIHFFEGVSKAAEQLSALYDRADNSDSALAYFRIYKNAFDSLFSENNSLNVVIRESEWLMKKKEMENEHLQQVAELQKRQLVFKNALLLGSVILLAAVVLAAFFIYKSVQSRKKRTEAGWKQKIAESQIRSLRAQMNPHFIFNSLNSIENFMMQNEKRKASDYLHKFALLIRTILETSQNDLTTIGQDMAALKLYIDLEQMRFNNTFTYYEQIDPQLLSGDYNVPSLLIQPYVENAIVHGLAHCDRPDLALKISAVLEDDFIKYTIEDNGVGRSSAERYNRINKLHHKSVGLKISEDRILLFNRETSLNGHVRIIDLFDAGMRPGGTRVEIKLKAV